MSEVYADSHVTLYRGDALEVLGTLEAGSVQCVITSPPYWGLRDYGVVGQVGLEETPGKYVSALVEIFRAVRRVLRDDGTVWVNLGDSYATGGTGGYSDKSTLSGFTSPDTKGRVMNGARIARGAPPGLKPKDLVGIPWRVAFALQQPYYTGRIQRIEDRIWLAAMLDAEGCLFIHRRKAGQHNGQGYYRQNDSYSPGVEISNTSLAVVERVMALVGQGSICSQGPEENGRRRQRLYRWNLRTNECRDFVREVYPHLIAKRQQARILYGCPASGERATAAHTALIHLHRRGSSDVDFPDIPLMHEPGYYLRSDIVWSKLNPMPESVTDRATKSHEYVFMLAKSERYFWDQEAVRERLAGPLHGRGGDPNGATVATYHTPGIVSRDTLRAWGTDAGRNLRSVWTIATAPYPDAHFATFPPDLVVPCVKAGTSEYGACAGCGAPWARVVERTGEIARRWSGQADPTQADNWRNDNGRTTQGVYSTTGWAPTCGCGRADVVPCVVLDPFVGSGTAVYVAKSLGRRGMGIDLNAQYLALAANRLRQGVLDFTTTPAVNGTTSRDVEQTAFL